MTGVDADGLLYHYTTSEVFFKILRCGKLRLTDPRFLNDSREWKHAASLVADAVKAVAPRIWPDWKKAGTKEDDFNFMIDRMVLRFNNLPLKAHHPANDYNHLPFIFSLSGQPDSLSQWRAYGKGECCIGFDPAELASRSKGRLKEVSYSGDKNRAKLETDLAGYLNGHIRSCVRSDGSLDTEFKHSAAEAFEVQLRNRDFFISQKDAGFQDELETRLIKYVPFKDAATIFLDGSGRIPIPRIRIKLFDPKNLDDVGAVVKRVVYGPGIDRERAQTAYDIMSDLGQRRFEVKYSSIPFRSG